MGKKLLATFLVLLVLFVGAVAFLPTYLSTSSGKSALFSYLGKKTAYDISAEKVSLSWFGTQEIQGLKVQERSGKFSLECPHLKTTAPLLSVVKRDFQELSLDHPSFVLKVPNSIARAPKKNGLQKAALLPSLDLELPLLPITAQLNVTNGELAIYKERTCLASYHDLNVNAKIPAKKAPISFQATGITQEGEIQGNFQIQGSLNPQGATLDSKLSNFPVRGLDALVALFHPEFQGLLLEGIGPSLNLNLQGALTKEELNFQLKAQAAQLTAKIQTASKNGTVYLPTEGTISAKLSPAFATKISKLIPALGGLCIQKELPLEIRIQKMALPLSQEELDLSALSFEAVAQVAPGQIFSKTSDTIDLTELKLSLASQKLQESVDLKLNINARVAAMTSQLTLLSKIDQPLSEKRSFTGSFNAENLSLSILETMSSAKGMLVGLLGDCFNACGNFSKAQGSNQLTVQANSSSFEMGSATFSMTDKLTLKAPVVVRLFPTKAQLAKLFPKSISLQQGSELSLTLQKLELPSNLSFDEMTLQADFCVPPMTFDQFLDHGPLSLPKFAGTIDVASLKKIQMKTQFDLSDPSKEACSISSVTTGGIDRAKNSLSFTSQLELLEGGKNRGIVDLVCEAKQLSSATPLWSCTADGKEFSIEVVENLLKKKEAISPLLGKNLNFHLEAQNEKVELKATSPTLNVHGTLTWKDQLLQVLGSPLEIYYTMNEESFLKLERLLNKNAKKAELFELAQPSVFAATVSKLKLPLSQKFSWDELQANFDVSVDKFAFQEPTSKKMIKIEGFHMKGEKKEASSPLEFELTSQIATAGSADGKILCTGKIKDFKDHTPTLDFNAEISQFPTAIFDLVSQLSGKKSLAPLFGESLEAKASAQLANGSGPVQLNVRSPNTRFELVGSMKEGVLSLQEAVHAQILMNESLSALLLSEVNPLSISSISSPNPLTLEIQPEGFSLPLNNWRTLTLSHAKIELGQISCQNEGTFKIALGLLKSKEFSSAKNLDLWFAPIEFAVSKGMVALDRCEILVDHTYEIATWGKLDLVEENVDMVLGLTAQCLQKAFSIQNLPPDYMIQIPMKGKMNDVKINTKAATAKVAALLIWQQKSNSGVGGIAGGLGEMIGKLATLPDRGEPAPAPKHPFPWELYKPNGKEIKKDPNPALKRKNRIQKSDKPLKQLLKILR